MIVDWEYAGRGDGMFDLGNAVVNNELDDDAAQRLLTGYDGTAPDERRRAQLALMKVASDAREGAWGVLQGLHLGTRLRLRRLRKHSTSARLAPRSRTRRSIARCNRRTKSMGGCPKMDYKRLEPLAPFAGTDRRRTPDVAGILDEHRFDIGGRTSSNRATTATSSWSSRRAPLTSCTTARRSTRWAPAGFLR